MKPTHARHRFRFSPRTIRITSGRPCWLPCFSLAAAAMLLSGPSTLSADPYGTIDDPTAPTIVVVDGVAGNAGSDGSVNVVAGSDLDDAPLISGAGLPPTGRRGAVSVDLNGFTGSSFSLILDGSTAPLQIGDPSVIGTTTNPGEGLYGVILYQDQSADVTTLDSFEFRTEGEVLIQNGESASNGGGVTGRFFRASGDVLIDLSEETTVGVTSFGSNGDGIFFLRRGLGGDLEGSTTIVNRGTIRTRSEHASQTIIVQHNEATLGDITITTAETSELFIEALPVDPGDRASVMIGIYAQQISSDSESNIYIDADGLIDIDARPSSHGIWTVNGGSGETELIARADIITRGEDSYGVYSDTRNVDNDTLTEVDLIGGDIETTGDGSHGIFVLDSGSGDTAVGFSDSSIIETAGVSAHGIQGDAQGSGDLLINAESGSILTPVSGSSGIVASAAAGQINVEIGATILAGTDTGSGVVISGTPLSAGIAINPTGSVSASSDRAISALGGPLTIENSGEMLGFITLGDFDDSFINSASNSWNLRDFADTNSDLIRDTESVALSDFGAGNDTYTNTASGTLRLLTVEDMSSFTPAANDDTAPTSWDTLSTAEYFTPGSAARSITDAGVEQAHLVNLETFEHAGLITMADAETGGLGPVAGDVLVITGGAAAGTPSGGLFVSEGGRLHIDTVLNDGQTDTSDVLVVDNATLGAGGATLIQVTNASPGAAASTDINGNGQFDSDEGILVVEALESSDADTFALAAPVAGGAFEYLLDQTDGASWYLHSVLSSSTSTYEAAAQILLDGFTRMSTLEQRVGQRRWNSAAESTEPSFGGWVRVAGDQSDVELESGTSYEADSWGMQAGYDVPVEPGTSGQWIIGLTAQTGRSSAQIFTATGNGDIKAEGLGFGATATWYGQNDVYVDIQTQVNRVEVDYASSLHGDLADDERARALAASVEIGRRYALDASKGLIPQAQIVWADIDGGAFTDSAGSAVDIGSNSRLTGRVGLAFDYKWGPEAGQPTRKLYAIANLLHDFSNETSVNVAGVTLDSEQDATWGELGVGGSIHLNESTQLYGELAYRNSFSSGDNNAIAATGGLRIRW